VWNSHAFNLTQDDTIMNGWVNVTYTNTRTHVAQGLFDSRWIFTQHVPPFQQREYCATHTFPDGTHLFQLASHTHRHGIRWRYFDAPQQPCPTAPGSNTNADCMPGDSAFYESYDYSDPLTVNYDPPKYYTGDVAHRTVKFCSLYDNGQLDPDTVKRQSTSPTPTGGLIFGGPCSDADVVCMGGTNKGLNCHGNDSECPDPNNPANPSGIAKCDACELLGGVTTEDEMFIALGAFYTDSQ
ncbi:MAG TPA: hypothetical protein VGK20_18935, partial [Candidatus Binatia bacterium]|jgi:hypothetical protein